MKRIICVCLLAFLAISSTSMTTHAQSPQKSNEQALDQLMLDLFHNQIQDAVTNYYKNDSVKGIGFDWFNQDYNVVEVDQTEKGHRLKSAYVVNLRLCQQLKNQL